MFDFLETLEVLHRSFWYVALFSSLVFVVQAVLTFIGSDSTDGTAPDFDGDFDGVDAPFQLFSLRNLTNFLLGFGWAGVAFYPMVENKFLLTILAAAVGVGFVLIFFLVIKQLLKLSEDNTFKINDLKNNIIGTIDSTTHTIPQPTCLLNMRNIPPATISPAITNFMYLFIPKSF